MSVKKLLELWRGYAKGERAVMALLALVFGFMIACGASLERSRSIGWGDPLFYLATALASLVCFAVLACLWVLFDKFAVSSEEWKSGSRRRLLVYLASLLALLVGWGLVWLAAYPGYWAYDTGVYLDYAQTGVLNDKHPVLHTMMAGSFLRIGADIFGSYNAGIALYTLVQLAIEICLTLNIQRCLMELHVPRSILGSSGGCVGEIRPKALMMVHELLL